MKMFNIITRPVTQDATDNGTATVLLSVPRARLKFTPRRRVSKRPSLNLYWVVEGSKNAHMLAAGARGLLQAGSRRLMPMYTLIGIV